MLAEVAKLFCLFSLFFFLHFYKKKTDKTGKPSWLLKLHHATINKGVVKKKSVGGKEEEERKEERTMEERKVFCARWLFCEALAQEAVAVVVVVVVCVELVVEVVLKSDFCAGCFPVCGMCRAGGKAVGWYQEGFLGCS